LHASVVIKIESASDARSSKGFPVHIIEADASYYRPWREGGAGMTLKGGR